LILEKPLRVTVVADWASKNVELAFTTNMAFTKIRISNIESRNKPENRMIKKTCNSAPFSNFGVRICFEFLDLRSAFDEGGRFSIFGFTP